MGKSSSTKKRKRSSKSSSRGRSRKKTELTRNKSKKYRNRHDSSSDSDDDLESSVYVSSSSSEDSYSSRSRSRTRKDAKRSKRRSRAVSSSSEDSHVRKRKQPKRSGRSEVRKRKNVKRKSGRDVSTTLSCSTCSDSSSDNEQSEYERYQGSPKRRDNKRKPGNIKRGSSKKRYRDRSRSCSYSGHAHTGNSDHRSLKREAVVDYSRKLRSVVTVNHGIQIDSDEHKEELIYDRYDYPTRSNDSNSREHEMDPAYKSQVPEGKGSIDDEIREDAAAPNDKETTKLKDRNNTGTGNATVEQRNETCSTGDTDNINDLETILRLKALENLKKFRNRSQGTTKDANSTASISMAEPSQKNSVEIRRETTTLITDSDYSLKEEEEKVVDRKNGDGATVSAEKKVHSSSQLVGNSSENVGPTIRSGINRQRLFTSALRQSFSKTSSTPTEARTSLEARQAKSIRDSHEGNNSPQPADNVPPPSSNCITEIPNNTSASTIAEHSSSIPLASGDTSATKSQDEGEGGSQLEKKTMSVMRNGEMVEVSYKVYIPKKAPALARRPLKR